MVWKLNLALFSAITLVFIYDHGQICASPVLGESTLEQLVTDFKSKLSSSKNDWIKQGIEILDSGRLYQQLKWISERKGELDFSKYNILKDSPHIDPDANRDLTQLIVNQGYPVEQYVVQTKDGYLLDLHRIPHGRNNAATGNTTRPAVFLQHGLLSSACDWVMNFPHDSLGFMLADNGYDVWMGNSRGNTYSRHHVKYNTNDEQFWDFSFDEMAVYDTPAFIDHILQATGQSSVYYIGHSQGTVMAFALFATKPEYQKKVRLFVGLAPIIRLNFMESPIKYISIIPDKDVYRVFGRKDFLPHNFFIEYFVDHLCGNKDEKFVCYNLLFLMSGPDITYLNQSRMTVYMNHSPAGASVKDMLHFAQMYRSKSFTMYDYGSDAENMLHYNRTTPPAYDASKVTVPSLLFTAPNDWLADPKDVEMLESSLPNIVGKYTIPKWNHLDFVWATNAGPQCYSKILEWLPKF